MRGRASCPRTAPPDDRLASRFVERRGAARQRESEVDRRLSRGDSREHTVPHDAAREIFVEAEVYERLDEVPGLRVADRDHVLMIPATGFGRACAIRGGVAEERDDVARRGQADAKHERILRRVDQLVEPAGSKPPFRHSCVGSGVPGNGVVRQSANAQSHVGHDLCAALLARRALAREHVNVADGCARSAGG